VSYITYTHLYADADGNSHFKDVDIKTPNENPLGLFSEPYDVNKLFFRHSLPCITDWTPIPVKYYVIYLSGSVSVEVSSGETRTFKTGDILYCTDVEGTGHRATVHEEGVVLIITTP
jgi:hypothetical protein